MSFYDQRKIKYEDDAMRYLVSVEWGSELLLLQSLLEAEEIPVLVKRTGIVDYKGILMGYGAVSADLFVPADMLTTAQEMLAALQEQKNEEDSDDTVE